MRGDQVTIELSGYPVQIRRHEWQPVAYKAPSDPTPRRRSVPPAPPKEGSHRARIRDALAVASNGLTLMELRHALTLSRGAISGMLHIMVEAGDVVTNGTRKSGPKVGRIYFLASK